MVKRLTLLMDERKLIQYSDLEKTIIAYSISWEGLLTLGKKRDERQKSIFINVANTEKSLMENFMKIVRCGRLWVKNPPEGKNFLPVYIWSIHSIKLTKHILSQILPYMPSERKRKVSELILEYCNIRIKSHENKKDLHSYNQREEEIFLRIKQLNSAGMGGKGPKVSIAA